MKSPSKTKGVRKVKAWAILDGTHIMNCTTLTGEYHLDVYRTRKAAEEQCIDIDGEEAPVVPVVISYKLN